MRVNGALQGRWHSIGDECADMTVIHGDVYSKPGEGERLKLRGLETGNKKKEWAFYTFLLNLVKIMYKKPTPSS